MLTIKCECGIIVSYYPNDFKKTKNGHSVVVAECCKCDKILDLGTIDLKTQNVVVTSKGGPYGK